MLFCPSNLENKRVNEKTATMKIYSPLKSWTLRLALSVSPLIVEIASASDASMPKPPPPKANPMDTGTLDQAAISRKPEMPSALHTLQAALESAYRNNTELKELQAQLRSRDNLVPQALAGWRPTINLNASLAGEKDIFSGSQKEDGDGGITTKQNGQNVTTTQAGLELTQNLFNGGKTVSTTCQAESLVQNARALLTDKEREILLAAVQAYFTLIARHAELELRKSNESTLLKTLEATKDKFNVGEETRTAIAQAEAEHADAIAKRQTAEAQVLTAEATFERITGARPGKLQKPGDPSNLPKSLKEAIEIAQKNNPAIMAALFQEKADRSNIKVTEADLLPKVDLQATSSRRSVLTRHKYGPDAFGVGGVVNPRSQDRDFTTAHSVSLSVKVPIYEAGAIRGKSRELRETAENSRIRIESKRREIIQQLAEAWETYLSAKASIKNYQAQVQANKVALEGTRQEMLVGSKILLDVLNAQRTLVQSQLNLVQEEQRYYQAAYTVLALMGRLTALDMKLQVKRYDPNVHYQDVRYSW